MRSHFAITLLRRMLAAGCLLLAACQSAAPVAGPGERTVPLPRLPDGPVELRVAYLVNPRLPRMDAAQLQALLAATRQAVWEHFGVEVRFTTPREMPIAEAFAAIPPARRARARAEAYDFVAGTGDRARLDQVFTDELPAGGPLAEQVAYAQPFAPGLRTGATAAEFGHAMVALQLQRLAEWRRMPALDGGPAIDGSGYNGYPFWVALGYAGLPYELLLTNQLIASIEYVDPEVHAAVRGGYANGLTTYGSGARYGTVSVWSTFGFSGNGDDLVRWRDGERYTPDEAARLAGVAAAHEIGHQLFHFLHPFGKPACLMDPVPMFAYRAWAARLSARDCPIGSDPAMVPGAYVFTY